MPDETPVTDAPAVDAPPAEAPAPVAPAPPAVEAVAPAAPDPAPAPVTPTRRRSAPPPVEPPPVEVVRVVERTEDSITVMPVEPAPLGSLAVSAWPEGAAHRAAGEAFLATGAAATAAAALGIESGPEVLPPYVVVEGKRYPVVVDPRGPGCVAVTVNVNGADATRTAESLRVALAMLGREFGEVVT